MEVPPVRFARNRAVSLAYQTWGSGPAVVAVPPAAQNIELGWERKEYRQIHERFGSFSCVLHFDKRGTGASDRTVNVPTLDERVEDLAAVMDDAGVERAFLVGVSEGRPVALAFAATFPRRVDGVVLLCSGARIFGDVTPEERAALETRIALLLDRWGTDESIAVDLWAPSLASDPSFRAWEPRYERQSASPAAIRELFEMIAHLDVRPLLAQVDAPVLVIHRRDDPALPLERAREAAAGLPHARLVVVEGHDHWAHAGDIDAWMDHIEAFVTGGVQPRPGATCTQPDVVIRTMGRFAVIVNGTEVPAAAWGSRRARQLCKRLAVASASGVTRDELYDQLWPDETGLGRSSARLSVVLSKLRRVLGIGVIADRSAIRLDTTLIRLDLDVLRRHVDAGRDADGVAAHTGDLLPEDAYEDWAIAAREKLTRTMVGAHRRLAARAAAEGSHSAVAQHADAILELDSFDEQAHELLVGALFAAGRLADAVRADKRYRSKMAELGVRSRDLLALPAR